MLLGALLGGIALFLAPIGISACWPTRWHSAARRSGSAWHWKRRAPHLRPDRVGRAVAARRRCRDRPGGCVRNSQSDGDTTLRCERDGSARARRRRRCARRRCLRRVRTTGAARRPHRPAPRAHGLVSSEGRCPSDSPTRSLARRFAGSLRSRGSPAALARAVTTRERLMRSALESLRGA